MNDWPELLAILDLDQEKLIVMLRIRPNCDQEYWADRITWWLTAGAWFQALISPPTLVQAVRRQDWGGLRRA